MTSPKSTSSPKELARTQTRGLLVMTISSSVSSGGILVGGVNGILRGDAFSWLTVILALALFATAILLARKVWQAVP